MPPATPTLFLYNIATATYQQVDDPHAMGSVGTVINGLNDNGQIVGFFTDANGMSMAWLAQQLHQSRRYCSCCSPACSGLPGCAAASPNRALPQQIKTISKQSPVPRKAAPQPPDAIGAARSLCSGPPSGRFPRFAGLGVW